MRTFIWTGNLIVYTRKNSKLEKDDAAMEKYGRYWFWIRRWKQLQELVQDMGRLAVRRWGDVEHIGARLLRPFFLTRDLPEDFDVFPRQYLELSPGGGEHGFCHGVERA